MSISYGIQWYWKMNLLLCSARACMVGRSIPWFMFSKNSHLFMCSLRIALILWAHITVNYICRIILLFIFVYILVDVFVVDILSVCLWSDDWLRLFVRSICLHAHCPQQRIFCLVLSFFDHWICTTRRAYCWPQMRTVFSDSIYLFTFVKCRWNKI